MPDITAARPVAGAPIESTWGGQVHDNVEGIQTGSVVVTLTGASNGTAVVTFPRAYTAPPKVFLTIAATTSNTMAHCWVPSAGVTTTQLNIAAGRDDSTTVTSSITVNWLAIGTPA